VFPDSPASDAGLARGDRIVAVNDRSVQALVESGEINAVFGPSEAGYGVAISVERDGAEPYAATMTKRVVTIPTVSLTKVFEVDGRRVGYVLFRNFVEPSIAALDQAFDELRAQNVTELVLDLRYNGGGLVSVAQHLASLIGGTRTRGLVLGEYFHNDKNTARNKRILFEEKPNALTLERLFVIATRSTASASELIVNGLRPFVPVTIVGGTTYGKPVGQYGFTICDKILFPVAFTIRNANGQADYFTGIPADCPAADDASRQLGDASESSLAASLELVRTGTCPGAAAATPERRVDRERTFLRSGGFRDLVNAY
jgi:C-terminal peptidase prc